MTTDELLELFEKHGETANVGQFNLIEYKRSQRRDLHAFLLLNSLFPFHDSGDMVVSAAHDQIWLFPNMDKLAEVITEAQVIELLRCGVWYDSHAEALSMFV